MKKSKNKNKLSLKGQLQGHAILVNFSTDQLQLAISDHIYALKLNSKQKNPKGAWLGKNWSGLKRIAFRELEKQRAARLFSSLSQFVIAGNASCFRDIYLQSLKFLGLSYRSLLFQDAQ